MEFVQPIRDKGKIKQVKDILRSRNLRDYALFTLGINSGLRISDLLNLKLSDVLDEKGKLKDRIFLREKKNGKAKQFPIGPSSVKALKEYLDGKRVTLDECLFPSRKGVNKPLSRVQAYRVLNNACRTAGLKESIGTHTMRKTFGYWAYKEGMDISVIQKLLNHSSPGITLAYIGITQDDLDNVYMTLNL